MLFILYKGLNEIYISLSLISVNKHASIVFKIESNILIAVISMHQIL